jgi:hypothetical protein
VAILLKCVYALFYDGHTDAATSLLIKLLRGIPKTVFEKGGKMLKLSELLHFHQHAGTLPSFMDHMGALVLQTIQVFFFGFLSNSKRFQKKSRKFLQRCQIWSP